MGKLKLLIGVLVVAAAVVAAIALRHTLWMVVPLVVLLPLAVLGIYDVCQRQHTVLRNYPVLGHFRYLLEDFRHHFRQYFIQPDIERDPFSHEQRGLVYKRAKNVDDVQPFGTLHDLDAPGTEWLQHSVAPSEPLHRERRLRIGGPYCRQPYDSSHLNISAMSFGALSSNAVLALNSGARRGGFAHNTGEGGISEFHRRPGGDLIWEIGSGYFGCRQSDGSFDPGAFAEQAADERVKMVEIKLSQGAKPGGGGILPACKLTASIARARGVPMGRDVVSPAAHSAFSTPRELLQFVQRLRELSDGKPVGFKLCVGQPRELMAIVKAMHDTDIMPDFITVDGAEGGTGAAPLELTNAVGTPLRDGLVLVHNTLVGAGLRERVRVLAAGKVISGFDVAARIAMGADACYAARAMMFALGCIQARRCHTNRCPTGVATQDPWRVQGLSVVDKSERVAQYHANTIKHLLKLLAAAGLSHPGELRPEHLQRRVSRGAVMSYRELHQYVDKGALLEAAGPAAMQRAWQEATPDRFQ